MNKKIKVLIVDDSALVRSKLTEILNEDQNIEVIATAADPYIAVNKIKANPPDVITLDLEMPRMNGLVFLKKLMDQRPIPVVVISSYTPEGSEKAMQAYASGAVEVIGKPKITSGNDLHDFKMRVCDGIKAAAQAQLKKLIPRRRFNDKLFAREVISGEPLHRISQISEKIVVVGASTGGTVAIEKFLKRLPRDFPGVVIVQHMPEHFTLSFANRLNQSCEIEVKEAKNGDIVLPGHAFIAPGNFHLLLKSRGKRYYLEVRRGPLVNRHRPSVDVLFRSAARYAGKNAIGIIMTGMGDDGARGMLEMMQAGARTIAQDKESCVVFGMPAEAIKLGGVEKVVSLDNIGRTVVEMLNEKTHNRDRRKTE